MPGPCSRVRGRLTSPAKPQACHRAPLSPGASAERMGGPRRPDSADSRLPRSRVRNGPHGASGYARPPRRLVQATANAGLPPSLPTPPGTGPARGQLLTVLGLKTAGPRLTDRVHNRTEVSRTRPLQQRRAALAFIGAGSGRRGPRSRDVTQPAELAVEIA